MTITVTIDQLKDDYKSYLQAENSQINAFAPNSAWSILAGGTAGVFLDLYYNLQLLENSIYVQNAIGDQVDQWLYRQGLPARGEQTYATIFATVTSTTPVTIPVNTQFTDSITGNIYQTLQEFIIASGSPYTVTYKGTYNAATNTPTLVNGTGTLGDWYLVGTSGTNNPTVTLLDAGDAIAYNGSIWIKVSQATLQQVTLYSTKAGSNYLEAVGATLTDNTITIIVTNSVNGQEIESDQSCINRILTSLRAPISGSRQTDYQVYALQYNDTLTTPVVTNSIPVIDFTLINNVGVFGLFVMGGTPITEYQLNQGLLPATTFTAFSRALDDATVTGVNDYIQSLRLVGLTIQVGTVITQIVETDASPLAASISLVPGYAMDTLITIPSQDVDNNPITVQMSVEDLIKREIRRAITTQQFGGTVIGTNNFITLDSIYYSVNLQLSYLNGALAQILTNMTITGGDISVPNKAYNLNNLYYIYDIESYNSITLTLVS